MGRTGGNKVKPVLCFEYNIKSNKLIFLMVEDVALFLLFFEPEQNRENTCHYILNYFRALKMMIFTQDFVSWLFVSQKG